MFSSELRGSQVIPARVDYMSPSLKLYSSTSSKLSTRWWYLSQWEHCTKMVPLARAWGFTSQIVRPPHLSQVKAIFAVRRGDPDPSGLALASLSS